MAVAAPLRAAVRDPEAVAVHRHGVDLALFAPGDRAAARAALELPDGAPILLVPARLAPVKGHLDLLAALTTVRREFPALEVICLGEGRLRTTLERRVREAGLEGALHLVGRRDDVVPWLAACDAVCLPSHVEGLPLALIEAAAAGRAAVATAVGGVPEVVVDGRSGLLVPPRDPAALARALSALLRDAPGREAMAAAARRRAERYFDERVAMRHLEDRLATWLAPLGVDVPAGGRASSAATCDEPVDDSAVFPAPAKDTAASP